MELLIRRYYKVVFGLVYRKTGDYHTACDLTQEVFVKVAQSIGQYQTTGSFKSWIVAITYHHCTDFYRSAQYRRRQNETEFNAEIADEASNIYRLLERKDERTRVRSALMQLPDFQRDTIILSYYEGMKMREIAHVMNCSEATVKSRLHQGLNKLRKFLLGGEMHAESGNHS